MQQALPKIIKQIILAQEDEQKLNKLCSQINLKIKDKNDFWPILTFDIDGVFYNTFLNLKWKEEFLESNGIKCLWKTDGKLIPSKELYDQINDIWENFSNKEFVKYCLNFNSFKLTKNNTYTGCYDVQDILKQRENLFDVVAIYNLTELWKIVQSIESEAESLNKVDMIKNLPKINKVMKEFNRELEKIKDWKVEVIEPYGLVVSFVLEGKKVISNNIEELKNFNIKTKIDFENLSPEDKEKIKEIEMLEPYEKYNRYKIIVDPINRPSFHEDYGVVYLNLKS
ncbi:MAG: hypothetical protein ACRC4M_03225 [Mycoplasma sp.]